MSEHFEEWKEIKAILWEALPQIDEVLNEANYPLSERRSKAFDLVRDTMLDTSDWKAFMLSPAHGQFLVLISQWYERRYGESAMADNNHDFQTHALIHGTPFTLIVPSTFRTPDKEPGLQWLGFPASVQKEENCLDWLKGGPNLKALDSEQREKLESDTLKRANFIRSTIFDLRALAHEPEDYVPKLADSARSNLESASRYLCKRSDADLRHAASDISQALEKALKLYLRRNGVEPPFTHDLHKLAQLAEANGLTPIKPSAIDRIPSGSSAASIRYEGAISLDDALKAYDAGVAMIAAILEACTPKSKYNVRELRLQIKTPPWFEFDHDGFLEALEAENPADSN